jgi:hypothetical protein
MEVKSEDYVYVGVIGIVSLSMLASAIMWKWASFFVETRSIYMSSHFSNPVSQASTNTSPSTSSLLSEKLTGKIVKRNLFYVCLLLAALTDIPMYAGFIVYRGYNMTMYSFHKLQAAFLFSAYSITISDWTTVLFEIKEDSFMPFLLRKVSLIFLNLMFASISVINFIYCYVTSNLQDFLNSVVYEMDLLFMILTPLILTVIMLRSGIKLSLRIQV